MLNMLSIYYHSELILKDFKSNHFYKHSICCRNIFVHEQKLIITSRIQKISRPTRLFTSKKLINEKLLKLNDFKAD